MGRESRRISRDKSSQKTDSIIRLVETGIKQPLIQQVSITTRGHFQKTCECGRTIIAPPNNAGIQVRCITL